MRHLLVLSLLALSACAAPSALPPTQVSRPLISAQSQMAPQASGPDSLPVHLRIQRAEIEVSSTELNRQFKHILSLSNEQRLREPVLRSLDANQGLELVGRVKAANWLPEVSFRVSGTLGARPGNVLRFSPTDIRVVGLPVKSLLDLIGVELSNIAKFKDRWGRVVQSGNDIDLIIEKFTQDAVIEGQIREVRTSASGVMVVF
ncbi:MAG: hypothetical protein ACO1RX_13710 [Candidatus Sericytochromatia bacterium]